MCVRGEGWIREGGIIIRTHHVIKRSPYVIRYGMTVRTGHRGQLRVHRLRTRHRSARPRQHNVFSMRTGYLLGQHCCNPLLDLPRKTLVVDQRFSELPGTK